MSFWRCIRRSMSDGFRLTKKFYITLGYVGLPVVIVRVIASSFQPVSEQFQVRSASATDCSRFKPFVTVVIIVRISADVITLESKINAVVSKIDILDCSKDLLEWGARVAANNSRPPIPTGGF